MRLGRGWMGCWLLLSATAQAADLEVTRVESAVTIRHADGVTAALKSHDPVNVGDVIGTGAEGHVSVRLAGGGSLLLGSDASLRLDGSAPPESWRAALARLQLAAGSVHLDARKTGENAPADLHLEMEYLHARLYGAEAWAERSAAGDELCLLSGAAEIDTPKTHQRLDAPGECLRWTNAGMTRLSAAEVGSLLPRLASTNFSDDYATRYAAQQALKEGQAQPTLADSAADAAPRERAAGTIAMTEIAPPAPPQVLGEWRIVLDSFTERQSAARAVTRWQKRKLSTQITATNTAGRTVFEVQCGHYASRELAAQALARLRKRPGYEGAKIAQAAIAAPTANAAAPAHAATAASIAANTAKPRTAAATSWRISLGSFIDHANAQRSVAQWKARSLSADIEPIRLQGRDAYRVLCGHYESREQAEAALKRLRSRAGYESARVLTVPDALSKR